MPTAMLVVFSLLIVTICADFYDQKYDSFDIGPLLENDRILLSFTRCFVDEGPCTPDAKNFKSKWKIIIANGLLLVIIVRKAKYYKYVLGIIKKYINSKSGILFYIITQ